MENLPLKICLLLKDVRLTDVLIPSYNEIAGLFGASDEDLRDKRLNPKTMCQYLTTLGPEVVGVKL